MKQRRSRNLNKGEEITVLPFGGVIFLRRRCFRPDLPPVSGGELQTMERTRLSSRRDRKMSVLAHLDVDIVRISVKPSDDDPSGNPTSSLVQLEFVSEQGCALLMHCSHTWSLLVTVEAVYGRSTPCPVTQTTFLGNVVFFAL